MDRGVANKYLIKGRVMKYFMVGLVFLWENRIDMRVQWVFNLFFALVVYLV